MINGDAVRLSDGLGGCVRVGVGRKVLGRTVDDRREPVWRSRHADIDGKVDQPFGSVAVSVVMKIMNLIVGWIGVRRAAVLHGRSGRLVA